MRLLADSLTSCGKESQFGILEYVFWSYAEMILDSYLFSRRITKNREPLDRTVDSIRERFGSDAVFRSSFLNSGVRFRSGGTVDAGNMSHLSELPINHSLCLFRRFHQSFHS